MEKNVRLEIGFALGKVLLLLLHLFHSCGSCKAVRRILYYIQCTAALDVSLTVGYDIISKYLKHHFFLFTLIAFHFSFLLYFFYFFFLFVCLFVVLAISHDSSFQCINYYICKEYGIGLRLQFHIYYCMVLFDDYWPHLHISTDAS